MSAYDSWRHWQHPCPVCGRPVRINKDGTTAAHLPPATRPDLDQTHYCPGSREDYPF